MSGDYVVYVDDNFHYMDEDERYEAGRFDTLEEAIGYCRSRVRENLKHLAGEVSSPDELMAQYTSFGEDPWISGPSNTSGVPFSARDYAREIAPEVFADCRA